MPTITDFYCAKGLKGCKVPCIQWTEDGQTAICYHFRVKIAIEHDIEPDNKIIPIPK